MENKIIKIDRSCVVASILFVKSRHFGAQYVSLEECEMIESILKDEAVSCNKCVVIDERYDLEYFRFIGDMFLLNRDNGINLNKVKDKYFGKVVLQDVLGVFCDDRLIYDNLVKLERKRRR